MPALQKEAVEGSDFVELLTQAGLRTDWDVVVEKLTEVGELVTWEAFYDELKKEPPKPKLEGEETAQNKGCC